MTSSSSMIDGLVAIGCRRRARAYPRNTLPSCRPPGPSVCVVCRRSLAQSARATCTVLGTAAQALSPSVNRALTQTQRSALTRAQGPAGFASQREERGERERGREEGGEERGERGERGERRERREERTEGREEREEGGED